MVIFRVWIHVVQEIQLFSWKNLTQEFEDHHPEKRNLHKQAYKQYCEPMWVSQSQLRFGSKAIETNIEINLISQKFNDDDLFENAEVRWVLVVPTGQQRGLSYRRCGHHGERCRCDGCVAMVVPMVVSEMLGTQTVATDRVTDRSQLTLGGFAWLLHWILVQGSNDRP